MKRLCLYVPVILSIYLLMTGCSGPVRESAFYKGKKSDLKVSIFKGEHSYSLSVSITKFPNGERVIRSEKDHVDENKSDYFRKQENVRRTTCAYKTDCYLTDKDETVCMIRNDAIRLMGSFAKAVKDFDTSLPTVVPKGFSEE